jgi:hypothetical protein
VHPCLSENTAVATQSCTVNHHPRTRLKSSAEPAPESAVAARPSYEIILYHLLGNATLTYVPGVTKSLLGIECVETQSRDKSAVKDYE